MASGGLSLRVLVGLGNTPCLYLNGSYIKVDYSRYVYIYVDTSIANHRSACPPNNSHIKTLRLGGKIISALAHLLHIGVGTYVLG